MTHQWSACPPHDLVPTWSWYVVLTSCCIPWGLVARETAFRWCLVGFGIKSQHLPKSCLFCTCRCTDFLKFFLDLERPEVNEKKDWNYELCGNLSMIQKKHYSSTRSVILEFHTDGIQANNTGFRGIFKFLDKGKYFAVWAKFEKCI